MDIKKFVLYAALFFVCLQLWLAWEKDYPNLQQTQQQVQTAPTTVSAVQPTNHVNSLPSKTSLDIKSTPSDRIIHVITDVFDISIDTLGGNIISAKLLNYPQDLTTDKKPFILLQADPNQFYTANSDIASLNKESTAPIQYESVQKSYQLMQGQDSINIELTGVDTTNGLAVKKIVTFKRGSYLVEQNIEIDNQSQTPWTGYVVSRFIQKQLPEKNKGIFGISSYEGASISDPASKLYEKVTYSDLQKNNLVRNINGGWIALQQHYFLTAWIPDKQQNNHFFSNYNNGFYTLGVSSPAVTVEPKQQVNFKNELYLGPEIAKDLKEISPGLDYTIDYGWLWYVSLGIFWLLKAIYELIGNWGWAIIFVTIIIKLLFYKLSSTSYYSMANMRKLQPKMQALKERHANDRQALSLATMELYKKEKINPLGGCWPILIQIPVFIALYWVLLESVELRQAPFMLWIKDLSAPDPYYVLPLLMGGTMLIQQMLSPTSPDPVQAKMMMLLPLFFTFLFLHFPSGLVLYWVVNNSISILQQWYITHKFDLEEKKIKERRR